MTKFFQDAQLRAVLFTHLHDTFGVGAEFTEDMVGVPSEYMITILGADVLNPAAIAETFFGPWLSEFTKTAVEQFSALTVQQKEARVAQIWVTDFTPEPEKDLLELYLNLIAGGMLRSFKYAGVTFSDLPDNNDLIDATYGLMTELNAVLNKHLALRYDLARSYDSYADDDHEFIMAVFELHESLVKTLCIPALLSGGAAVPESLLKRFAGSLEFYFGMVEKYRVLKHAGVSI